MEESKLQELVDTLSKHKKSQGLGVGSSAYSWAGTHVPSATTTSDTAASSNGLPQNALYSLFRKEGSYDPTAASSTMTHGDGRFIQRTFGDCSKVSDDNDGEDERNKKEKLTKEERKEQKKAERKAAKLEAKRLAKLEEKKRLKKEAKLKEEGSTKKRKAETEKSTPKLKKMRKVYTETKDEKDVEEKPVKKDKKVKKESKKKIEKAEPTLDKKVKKSKKGKSV